MFRLIMVSIYPFIILFTFFRVYKVPKYKKAITNNYKYIIINTLVITIAASMLFYVFFSLEDWIYDFDYVGHWYRALLMKEKFFLDPFGIPEFLHNSLNNEIYYSHLIAFFQIPIVIMNDSYGFFCFGSFIYFYVPVFILLSILYYTYFDKNKYLPLIIGFSFFQMYLCFFDGETECFGSFFIIAAFMLTIFRNFDEINWIDNLSINLFGYILIFGRRFYLYALVTIYLCYFVQYLSYYNFKVFNKKAMHDLFKIVFSGLPLLVACITIYNPFFIRVITNNYGEAYAYNNKPGKILALIGTFTPIIVIIAVYGLYLSLKKKEKIVFNLQMIISVLVPVMLFWHVQSFELHHYYLISFPFILFFACGLYEIINKRKTVGYVLCLIMLCQSASIFLTNEYIPFSSIWHRVPKNYPNKNEIVELSNKLRELTSDGSYIFMATGDGLVNYSVLESAVLPNLNQPNFLTSTYDIRDGFPVNLKYCKYVLISNPILYREKNIQQMYDVITQAITEKTCVSEIYELVYNKEIDGTIYSVYQRTGEYNDEIKEFFYSQMISRYPNNADIFKGILD